jgi:hypothetical protein
MWATPLLSRTKAFINCARPAHGAKFIINRPINDAES